MMEVDHIGLQVSSAQADNSRFIAEVIKNATPDQLFQFANEAYITLWKENMTYKSQIESLT